MTSRKGTKLNCFITREQEPLLIPNSIKPTPYKCDIGTNIKFVSLSNVK